MIKPVFQQLANGKITLLEAMDQIAVHFGKDARLIRWRKVLEELAGLMNWLPASRHARDYILGAFPLGHKALDQMHSYLIEFLGQPHLFLNPADRSRFDKCFLEYKAGYVGHYCTAHEDALNPTGGAPENNSRVDSVALRNLELLSKLHYTDRSYVNRVRIIGRWLERNHCGLPVRQILDRYPRCYCNFNPAGSRPVTDSAAQINAATHDGIEYYRAALRQCGKVIVEELARQKVDQHDAKQILAVMGHGPIVRLNPECIEILNKIILNNSSKLLPHMRAFKKRN
jgi:hypothetical protein